MSRKTRSKPVLSEINITPFTDVVLVLLIIFMVTTPMIVSGVNIIPPLAKTGELAMESSFTVSIDQHGQVFLDKDEISLEALPARICPRVGSNGGVVAIVNGDKRIKYENVEGVLKALKSVGVARYVFKAEKVGKADPPEDKVHDQKSQ